MALIDRPECGKDISSTAKECPDCGHPIEAENSGSSAVCQSTKKSIRKPIIIISMIIIAIILGGLVVRFTYLTLNEDEQLAYQNAMTLQSMMRDPESFRLYDEKMFLVKAFDLSGNGSFKCTYTVFRYGGTNGYGAITTDDAIFKDRTFLMDYADEPDKDDPNLQEKLEAKLYVELARMAILTGDSNSVDVVQIDVKKIKAKMDLD